MNRALPLAVGLLLLALLAVAWSESHRPRPVPLVPSITGQTEYCLTCHGDLPQISAAHPIDTFGCVSCHGGERLALDADLAHSTLRGGRNPSDLSVVEQSCGGSQCHSGPAEEARDHIDRVRTSLQSTYAGAIATVRYAFGLQKELTAQVGIFSIEDPVSDTGITALTAFDPAADNHPSITTFAQNCLHCHLSSEPLPGDPYARFTGCAACHTPASPSLPTTTGEKGGSQVHRLTTAIPYTQCNTCHNRGNYSLRDLQFHPRADQPRDRLHDYYQPIAQFTKCEYELDCVDCHTNGEAMGDGNLYSKKKEIQYVQCRTCHGTLDELPLTLAITDPNDIALRLSFLNPVIDLQVGDTIVVTEKGEPVWNMIRQPDGAYQLTGKVTKQTYSVPLVAGSACQQKPDEQESRYCHACHAVER